MVAIEKPVSLWVDMANWESGIKIDDFLVAVGLKQSNSVYHVAEVRPKPSPKPRMTRYHVKAYKSDLTTAIRRDESQNLIQIKWYLRKKKNTLRQ